MPKNGVYKWIEVGNSIPSLYISVSALFPVVYYLVDAGFKAPSNFVYPERNDKNGKEKEGIKRREKSLPVSHGHHPFNPIHDIRHTNQILDPS